MTGRDDRAGELETLTGGRLAQNLMHFTRILRAAGLPVGSGHLLDAVQAVQAAGIGDRRDFYWTLHAVYVTSHAQTPLFDQTFHVFWRKPALMQQMLAHMLPEIAVPMEDKSPAAAASRVAEALFGDASSKQPEQQRELLEVEARLTYSPDEVFRTKDFEQMTVEETVLAKRAIARLDLSRIEYPTRRFRPDPRGARIDMRRTLRSSLRGGGSVISLQRRTRIRRRPPIVALCDISGSMAQYSRILLHFLHALSGEYERLSCFVFGTRLTNVTRLLQDRDVDDALAQVSDAVGDWSGGTRIGECLRRFNVDWSRRLLGQGAVVLLITDGLDRDAGEGLDAEMGRLHRSCRHLIWLNPLLRYDGFEPKAAGVRAMLPHVDEFRPVHNLASLEELAAALSDPHMDKRQWRQTGQTAARS